MTETTGVTFDQVVKAATAMITQGIKPSVRGILSVTGGKTETVSKYLRDFNEKRNADVLKMADELGSSTIARLLADERTRNVKLQTLQESQAAEVKRLADELSEAKSDGRQLASAQGQLVELQKQLSQVQSELTLSERERESLSLALRSQG